MWVACQAECPELQCELLDVPLPSAKRGEEFLERHWEPTPEGWVVPLEGSAANEMECTVQHRGVSLEATLHNLWEGGPIDG